MKQGKENLDRQQMQKVNGGSSQPLSEMLKISFSMDVPTIKLSDIIDPERTPSPIQLKTDPIEYIKYVPEDTTKLFKDLYDMKIELPKSEDVLYAFNEETGKFEPV